MTHEEAPPPGLEERIETPAAGRDDVRERHAANRAAWNEAAGAYAREVEETIAFLRAGNSSLHPIERDHLGDLRPWCDVAVHLQCASGRDTLSLWNEGAKRVVGLDISDVHIANARRTAEALDAPATWHRCDVLDPPASLDGTADLVYTGRGAICWIHDLRTWGEVVARLLRPGGTFHILDDHPASALFAMGTRELRPSGYGYFDVAISSVGWPVSYLEDVGTPPERQSRKHERGWTLADVHGALVGAGLVVDLLGEHPDEYWDVFPLLAPDEKRKLPLTFSMRARRPR